MLVANFLSPSGCDTWLTANVTCHSLWNAARIFYDGSAEQPRWGMTDQLFRRATSNMSWLPDHAMTDLLRTSSRRLWTTSIETLALTDCVVGQCEISLTKLWSTQSPSKCERNCRTRTQYGNSWQSLPHTLTAGDGKKLPNRGMMELSLPHCRCQAAWVHPWKANATWHRPDL